MVSCLLSPLHASVGVLANGKVPNGFCFKKHCYEFRDSLLHEPEHYSVKAEFRVGA